MADDRGWTLERLQSTLEHVSDAFYVLDVERRFVYVNPAAEAALKKSRDELLGRAIWEVYPESVGRRTYREFERALEEGVAVAFETRSRALDAWIAVRAWPVPDGLAVLLWDVSERRIEEIQRERLYRERSRVARALQRTLLPSSLPSVPGVEVGIRYAAAGEGFEVGGDFYDLFEVEGGGWGLAVGDIAGKGPEAAALTSFARHTIRTAAARVERPEEVLHVLNEEILRQTEDDRLFTVVYGELEPGDGEAELRLACGGHPPPLVARAGGEVESFSSSGMILGATENARISGWTTRLLAGEAAVFYTDGVTEARSPAGEFFGEERLMALLRDLSGMAADEIAAGVEREVMAFQDDRARDDIALLVLRVSSGASVPETR